MHMIVLTSKQKPNESLGAVKLYDQAILPSNIVRSLGVFIDHKLSFHIQVAAAGAKTRSLASILAKLRKRKGATRTALHYLATTAIILTILRGLEAWWTGAENITRQLAPSHDIQARNITDVPPSTPITTLLQEACLPPTQPPTRRTTPQVRDSGPPEPGIPAMQGHSNSLDEQAGHDHQHLRTPKNCHPARSHSHSRRHGRPNTHQPPPSLNTTHIPRTQRGRRPETKRMADYDLPRHNGPILKRLEIRSTYHSQRMTLDTENINRDNDTSHRELQHRRG